MGSGQHLSVSVSVCVLYVQITTLPASIGEVSNLSHACLI